MRKSELRRMIREELQREAVESKSQMRLWKFLRDMKDDAGKPVRFHVGETNNGLKVDIYGKFDKEDI